jgi:hypothetical protein
VTAWPTSGNLAATVRWSNIYTGRSRDSGFEVKWRQCVKVARGALTVPLAAACAPVVPAPIATRPAGGRSARRREPMCALRRTCRPPTAPKPDYPASGVGYDDGFESIRPTRPKPWLQQRAGHAHSKLVSLRPECLEGVGR